MLDLKFIRENADVVKAAIKNRGMKLDLGELLGLDKDKRELLAKVEAMKAQRNANSDEIGRLVREKKDAKAKMAEMKDLAQKIKDLDQKVGEIDQKLANLLLLIPNIPHKTVPVGPPTANKVVKTWGEPKKPDFKPRGHVEIAEDLGIIDLPRAAKVAGSHFVLYKGDGAKLERALINFMLDLHTKKHGYKEVAPPYLVNRASMTGTGQLPKLEEDMYRLKDDDLFLIPTAEVPVTNMHANEVLKEEDLPIYYTAYTACFRREAGTYGKDTRGLTRVHQFDKVELVKFTTPNTSYDEHEKLLQDAEEVVQLLGIPYRVSILSTGDVSFAATKCYDIEAWAPGAGAYLEISSCSNFEDFQARRANIRYKGKDNKLSFVHTLNGSGVALARTVICILENYQQKDGSVLIPEALRPYMDNKETLEPSL
ncbi:MAG: serine--tRNA ligase [Candidatus Omnitrophota bacterium]